MKWYEMTLIPLIVFEDALSLDRLSKVFSLCDDGDGRLSLNELLHFAERGRQSLALKDTQVAMEESGFLAFL